MDELTYPEEAMRQAAARIRELEEALAMRALDLPERTQDVLDKLAIVLSLVEEDEAQKEQIERTLDEAFDEIHALAAKCEALVSEADDFAALIADARLAAAKAMAKFPQPNYVISKIAEESGEVVKAAIHCAERRETAENLRGEMVQTIAMLYRLWVEGDGVHGLPAVRDLLARTGGEHDRS